MNTVEQFIKERAEYYRAREEYTKIDVLQIMLYEWEMWSYGCEKMGKSAERLKHAFDAPLWIRAYYCMLG